ncbi:MAG TPA: thioesterase family protein [Levilinea sp.]|nr:thioesterase family protein [Levilinea sp.]
MPTYHFYQPIEVRYGDLDAQWHVNHAHIVSYIEHARLMYIQHLGLFDGASFLDLKIIVADLHVAYLAPIHPNAKVRVGVRVARIGNKSLTLEYEVEDENHGQVCARGETVMVAFDYRSQKSVPVSAEWRKTISEFEGIPSGLPEGVARG